MKMTVEELSQFCAKKLDNQRPMLSLWQTLAENFYPERADFTVARNLGAELSDNLLSSYPLIMRRDLGNSLGAMLRDGNWFSMSVREDEASLDYAGKAWLHEKTNILRRLMYDRRANFVGATKRADHDYVTFGQPVIQVTRNRTYNGLLYRTWHLRDCAWWEDETGQVAGVVRKWKAEARTLVQTFGQDRLHPNVTRNLPKENFKEFDVYHIWMLVSEYGEDNASRYASIYLDPKHQHVIEEVFHDDIEYVVPRFQTVAGSPYAYSPAAVAALPDSRMLQAMTHTLMEAGERYARPPLVGTASTVHGNIDLGSDGITWVDKEYDEKMGQALRPLYQDRGGFPIGLELRDDIKETLRSAFYISKLELPEVNRDMTAYEVQERMKQFRRETLPLFAPIESEYNGMLCETSFSLAFKMGFLGSPDDVPDSLRGRDVDFKFVSPLSESDEEKKANKFLQIGEMIAQAAQFDQGVVVNVDFDTAVRDAITGIGAPPEWLQSEDEVAQIRDQVAQEQAMAAMMQQEQDANA